MINKKITASSLVVFLILGTSLAFQNCSRTPFGLSGFGSADFDSLSSTEDSSTSNPVALLSAEQVFKSMSSVTGMQPNARIISEYNMRQSVLASGFELGLAT